MIHHSSRLSKQASSHKYTNTSQLHLFDPLLSSMKAHTLCSTLNQPITTHQHRGCLLRLMIRVDLLLRPLPVLMLVFMDSRKSIGTRRRPQWRPARPRAPYRRRPSGCRRPHQAFLDLPISFCGLAVWDCGCLRLRVEIEQTKGLKWKQPDVPTNGSRFYSRD
jgi:hypothetical protein